MARTANVPFTRLAGPHFDACPEVIEFSLHSDFAPLADRQFFLKPFHDGFEATDAGFEFYGFRVIGGRRAR